MIAYLLVPQVFFGLLFGLFIISILIVFSFNRQEKRSSVELIEKELVLKKEIAAKNELEKKLKEELSLSKQMYDGLKGQYEELENSLQDLNYPARAVCKQSETPPHTINSGPDIGLKSS